MKISIPFRGMVELALPDGSVKVLEFSGETPRVADVTTDFGRHVIGANALLGAAHALGFISAEIAKRQPEQLVSHSALLNFPTSGRPS